MRSKLTYGLIGIIIGVLLSTTVGALAGTPDGPGTAPGATFSYTLADIYHSLNRGTAATPSAFTEPTAGPGTGTMFTLDEIYTLTRQRAPVAKTGQTTGYAAGDDGTLQKGVAWPNPRFITSTTGIVTDTLTGLIWLQNANCFGTQTWANALTSANTLNSGECGLSDGSTEGDWRLPNVREMHSLVHYGFSGPAVPNTAGTGQWTAGNPFTGVQSGYYWASTTGDDYPSYAWVVGLYDGNVGISGKVYSYYVWPVRGGQ